MASANAVARIKDESLFISTTCERLRNCISPSPEIMMMRLLLSSILACIMGCGTAPVPYQTYDNSLNRAVGNCLTNQSAITGLEAAGASLAVAAGGQGLGTIGLDGDAKTALAVSSAISGLIAAGLTATALGIQSRMKMKSCEVIMEKHRERMNFEIELKKSSTDFKWWPAAQEQNEGPAK